MSKYTDLIANPPDYSVGQRFGRLVVTELIPARGKSGLGRGIFICDCGRQTEQRIAHVIGALVKSCGCAQIESAKQLGLANKHNLRPQIKHGLSRSAEYRAWSHAKGRCYNPNSTQYAEYGGRGITMSSEWLDSFETFFSDMGPRPTDSHSLDRKDNDGPYSKDNCRWALPVVQSRNRRSNRLLTHEGITLTVTEWAAKTGIKRSTLNMRLRTGWPADQALRAPSRFRSKDGSPIWNRRRAT